MYVSTLEKEIRSKAFWIILLFTIFLLWILVAFARSEYWDIFQGHAGTVFFGVLMFWSYVLAAIFSVGVVRSDREEGTLEQLLAFPASRFTYLMARFLGGSSLVLFYHFLATVVSGIWVFRDTIPPSKQILFVLMTVPGICSVVVCGCFFPCFSTGYCPCSLSFCGVAWSPGPLQWWPECLGAKVASWGCWAHGFYWLFPHGSLWSEWSLRFLLTSEQAILVGPVFEVGHFCLSFALFFAILVGIFRYRDI